MPRRDHAGPGGPQWVPGEEIAGLKLLRLRGAGGQGVVYEAEEAATHRIVALKALLPGASSDDIRRFEREIDVLARLDHPNIPPLFDSGSHAGRPWFTMRMVDGPTIVEHARAQALDTRACARLILRTCDAVAHAHARGVIHRDIKPDNIRVDAGGEPQVLDFGLAKSAASPSLTQADSMLGTLTHSAPELLMGDSRKADVRADVYSVGVILYTLVAGRAPFDLPESMPAAVDVVRTREPLPPSWHRPGLSADLDAIVLKCIAKQPTERYATMLDLERDLQAWLEGRPVEARGRAPGYRLRKMLWRYRLPVAGATLAVASLIAFVVVLSLQKEELRFERDKARKMAGAFTDMMEYADPAGVPAEEVDPSHPPTANRPAVELVDLVGRRATYATDAEPRVRAAMMRAVGDAYMAIGLPMRAVWAYGAARGLLAGEPDSTPDELVAVALDEQRARSWNPAHHAEVAREYERIEASSRARSRSSPALLGVVLHDAAELARRRGRSDAALDLASQALAVRREVLGPSRETVETLTLAAELLVDVGRAAEALAVTDEAAAMAQAQLWTRHPVFGELALAKARALAALGRVEEAVTETRVAFARLEQTHGAAHPVTVAAAREGAAILAQAGLHAEAIQSLRDLLGLQRVMLGTHHEQTRETLLMLAGELEVTGQHDEAECLRAEAAIVKNRLDLALP